VCFPEAYEIKSLEKMWELVPIILLVIFNCLLIRSSRAKRKKMQQWEIAPAHVLKKKYNLTAENRPVIKIEPENVPINLRDLITMAEKWGICDDIIRVDFEEKASDKEKEEFKTCLTERTKEIAAWLDSFPNGKTMSQEASHFMYMLEALDEMKLWPD
jgi:hypothetical protein